MIASYNAWMSYDKLNVFVQLIHLQAALMIIKVLEVPNLLNLLSFVSAYCFIRQMHQIHVMLTAAPSTRSLTLIDWKDIKGRRKRLQLKQLMCMKWKEIGCLLEIPLPVLQAWGTTYRENPLECINPVLSHWLDECNGSEYYPISWEGLQCLLEDAELSEVTTQLKQALSNPLP